MPDPDPLEVLFEKYQLLDKRAKELEAENLQLKSAALVNQIGAETAKHHIIDPDSWFLQSQNLWAWRQLYSAVSSTGTATSIDGGTVTVM